MKRYFRQNKGGTASYSPFARLMQPKEQRVFFYFIGKKEIKR